MATKKKTSNNNKRKSSSTYGKQKGKRSYKKKSQKQEEMQKALFHDEIVLVVTFVLSVLLLLSNFNLSGVVGKVINQITFGLIGFMAYFLPFLLFWGIAFYIANRGNRIIRTKIISCAILSVILSALIQLITAKNKIHRLTTYYQVSSQEKIGGGIIGGGLINLLNPLFGTVGSYVILIGFVLICLMFITGKALFVYLSNKSENKLKQLREENLKRKEESQLAGDDNSTIANKKKNARTFLLKNNIAKISGKKPKNEQDSNIEKTSSSADKPTPVFTMEEIRPDNLDIPIYRAQPYTDGINASEEIKTDDIELQKISSEKNQDLEPRDEILKDEIKEEIKEEKVISDHERTQKVGKTGTPNSGYSKSEEIEKLELNQKTEEKKAYVFPPIDLLSKPKGETKGMSDKSLKETAIKLQSTLDSFGVGVAVTNVSCGPAVTRYELQPEQGVKVSRITALADDIKLNLAAPDIRIEAPIPGKAAVGIEVPNKENSMVMFRELLESKEFKKHSSKIAFAVGKDIGGKNIVTDIGKMPHLLIAGATGSGKSVCINTLIMSIIYKAKPSDVKLIMVDPKVVELSVYNGIPHLLLPVVTDPKKAAAALNWAVVEMTERYKKFADLGVRDIKGYNEKVATVEEYQDEKYQKLPQIVIVVDELADLMMVAPGEVEDAICRLAQMARAAGLHLIIATQRPSVNVITGLIKANIPSRIAFAVSSAVDSRTIIDSSGAEKLLGKGDMLFFPSGYSKPIRVQGAFISDKEVSQVVEYLAGQGNETTYNEEIVDKIVNTKGIGSSDTSDGIERDEYFAEAGRFIIEKDKASIGMLQRVYKIGFNRAARIMDQLAQAGTVGPEEGTKPRKVLMSAEEFEQYLEENL